MEHVAHAARLDQPLPNGGGSAREHLLGRITRLEKTGQGDSPMLTQAIAELDGPEAPASLSYLLRWHRELFARSGEGMHGYSGLTWGTLDAWARQMQTDAQPHEIDALFTLDAVRRHPPKVS